MKIKFNSIQDLSDARYAAAVMADWIGFSIDGQNVLSIEKIQEILGWCSGPKIAIEISEPHIDLNKLKSWMDVLPIDGIECETSLMKQLQDSIHEPIEWIETGVNFKPISPSLEFAKSIKNDSIESISVDCIAEVETGRKDYSSWNDFFEELEIL